MTPSSPARRPHGQPPDRPRQRRPGPAARLGGLLRALAGLAAAFALLAASPVVMWRLAGWPLPDHLPSRGEVETALTSPLTDGLLLGALACLYWYVYLALAVSTLAEAAAAATGRTRPRLRATGPAQTVAALLVGTVAAGLLTAAARAGRPAHTDLALASYARTDTTTAATADPAATRTTGPRPPPPSLVVAPRDTLWGLAETHLGGDGYRWREIFDLNAGRPQPDGATLTDPDLLRPGWTLLLPAGARPGDPPGQSSRDGHHRPPPGTSPPPATGTPEAPPASPAPETPDAPGTLVPPGETPHPADPPADRTGQPATSLPGQPGWTPTVPPSPTGTRSGQAPPGPGAAETPPPSAEPAGDEYTLPSGAAVGAGLAAAVAAAVVAARVLRHRSRPVPTPPGQPVPTDPPLPLVVAEILRHRPAPAPDPTQAEPGADPRPADTDAEHVPAPLDPPPAHPPAPADDVGDVPGRLAPPGSWPTAADPADLPAPPPSTTTASAPTTRARPGPTADPLPALPAALTSTGGLALVGPDAPATARALLLTVLAARHAPTGREQPGQLVLPAALAHQLDLPADLLAALPEVTLAADTAAAVDHAEADLDERRQLLAGHHATTLGELRAAAPDHALGTVLLAAVPEPELADRLDRLAADGAALDVLVLAAGHWPGHPTATPGPQTGGTWPRLAAGQAADLLRLLADAHGHPTTRPAPADPEPRPGQPAAPEDRPPPGDAATPPPAPDSPAPEASPPATASPTARLVLFGRPRLLHPDGSEVDRGLRALALDVAAYLAAHPRAGAPTSRIAAALLADADDRKAASSVHTAITNLRTAVRRALGDRTRTVVAHGPAGYRLDPADLSCDLWEFHHALDRARAAPDDTTRAAALHHAADLYQGRFLDATGAEWAGPLATTLEHKAVDAHADLADLLADDHPDRAVALLEQAIGHAPTSEGVYAHLMRLHAAAGRTADVHRTYRGLVTALAEYDTDPSPELRHLHARLAGRRPPGGGPAAPRTRTHDAGAGTAPGR